MLVVVVLTASLLPFVGFASEEAEACPAGPEVCGWVYDALFGNCDVSTIWCSVVKDIVDNLEFSDCEPVCDVVTTVMGVDPWGTVSELADDLPHRVIERACAVGAGGPEEEVGGLALRGYGAMACAGQGGPPVRMSITACIQMNAAPGQAGWVDMYCNANESLPFEDEVHVEVIGLCVPGPGDGNRWRVRATGEAWFNNPNQPADVTAVADSYGRRHDCQP